MHRDLKPANVYMHHEPGAESLVVKVLDFDQQGRHDRLDHHDDWHDLGSPAYMSPEQAKGERYVDSRSDLWSCSA
ncbi:MAG: hypothetical protein R3B70_39640 [Polyangiaceae bacterium]